MRCCKACALIVLFAFVSRAIGDSWAFEKGLTEQVHEFGRVKIVMQIDARENQSFPPHKLTIYRDGKAVAIYPNVGFQQIHASPDHRFFVGLSNNGISGTAFVIFDDRGNLIREMKHDFSGALITYSNTSVTRNRTWFDTKNPHVRFEAEENSLQKLLVKGSAGQTYDLLERDMNDVIRRPPEQRPKNER